MRWIGYTTIDCTRQYKKSRQTSGPENEAARAPPRGGDIVS